MQLPSPSRPCDMLHLEDDIISDKPLLVSFTEFCLCSIFAIITCFTHLFLPDYSFMDTHLYILVQAPTIQLSLPSFSQVHPYQLPPSLHPSISGNKPQVISHMTGHGSHPSFLTQLMDHPNFPWCGPQPYPWNFKLNSCFWPQPSTHSTLPSLWFQQNLLATQCKPPSNQRTPPPRQGGNGHFFSCCRLALTHPLHQTHAQSLPNLSNICTRTA